MPDKNLKLFVNYRRADEAEFVSHLRTHFMHRYGRENVFMDFDSIPPFTRFEEYIKSKVRESDVLVAIIGPKWLELLQVKAAKGEPDYVLIELTEALRQGTVIAPILIQGAKVPPEDQIPAELRDLFTLNIPSIGGGRDLLNNVGWLMDNLERELVERGVARVAKDAERAQTVVETVQERPSLQELTNRFVEAVKSEDYPTALLWAAEMQAVGGVPAKFKLEKRIVDIQEKLREMEEARRRREVASYLYGFVRHMVALEDSPLEIVYALEEVWSIDSDYDPDDMYTSYHNYIQLNNLTKLVTGLIEERRQTKDTLEFLRSSFEWCQIPQGMVTLEDKEYGLQPFLITKYPITNAQFNRFLEDPNGYSQNKWWDFSDAGREWRSKNPDEAMQPDGFQDDNQPCVCITWYEAMAFCRWLSNATGEAINLPTEIQWQYAAQGGKWKTYPWGDKFDTSKCNTEESGIKRTTVVDRYPDGVSPFGVLDMIGNVEEWVLNLFTNPAKPNISEKGDRVLRGGSWVHDSTIATTSHRLSYAPTHSASDVGFRCVKVSSVVP